MKTIGIIGGLGPETTSLFYLELLFLCKKQNKIQRPPILIYNVPMKFAQEKQEILHGACLKETKEMLMHGAENLERGGADFLVMPCNSLHVFIEEVKQSVTIPVLSIVDAVTDYLKRKQIKKVGIISTRITREKKLYAHLLDAHRITCLFPSPQEQKRIDRAVLNLNKKQYGHDEKKILERALDHFARRGVTDVLLACTDLQLLSPKHPRIQIHDTMKILAQSTIEKLLQEAKRP